MKVIDILNAANKPFPSFEFVPPLKGSEKDKLYNSISPLMEFKPPFINITNHRDEIEYRSRGESLLEKVTVTKRPGSVAISAAIMQKFDTEVVPHIICGGSSINKIENDLIDLNFLGVENVVALRGDSLRGEKMFTPELNGHKCAAHLVKQISRLNKGIYLDEELVSPIATNFCIGVAAYPEKHIEAPNLSIDIDHLQQKVNAGADYIITQMFFNNEKFFKFVDTCRQNGINVPILPGLKPISTLRHIEMLPKTFNLDLPEDLMKELKSCKSNAEVYEVGVRWCIMQTKDLLDNNCKVVHYYTMGKAQNIMDILHECF